MPHNTPDTAYIQTDPNCIGEHFIKARGKLFEHIAKIAEEMGRIAKSASEEREKSTRKLNAGEWYQNVVSILGERGSGKTILLLSACACLIKDKDSASESVREADKERKEQHEKICQKVENDILLPIIQPEYFGSEDTLITWVLTYLKDYIEDKNNGDKRDRFRAIKIKQYDNDVDDGVSPSEFIEEMRLSEALFSRKFSSNLAEQDVTAQDFQHETVKVIDSQFTFMRNWRKLINKLIVKDEEGRAKSTSTERKDHPFLIIPIDDADLNPATLPIILQQIQILQHPNVLFLFSVHKKSLHSMMYISQLELNTNRVDSRPVVNFGNLIQHGLRDVEDVRVDAWDKIEKFLPRKYRVEIQPLPPKERLNFKPLIKKKKTDKGKATPTFLQLLEQIPLDVFGNKRLKDITQFFDLAQSFRRCPLVAGKECKNYCSSFLSPSCPAVTSNTSTPQFPQLQRGTSHAISFCKVCELSRSDSGGKSCRSSKIGKTFSKYKAAIQTQNKGEIEQLTNELAPIPSVYTDALPKYPRAMEQVYKILYRWVDDIESIKTKNNEDDKNNKVIDGKAIEKKKKREAKELQVSISLAVKALLTACLEYIPQMPRAFHRRIKFIDNSNPTSKHPIQIDFETDGLTNRIEASAEGIEINASTDGNSSSILSIHSITNYLMHVPGRIRVTYDHEEKPYVIPNEWDYRETKKNKRTNANGDVVTKETKFYTVPNEYFALYNLAYDLTTSKGVFGRTSNNNQYHMRDNSPVSIFSVRAGTSSLFTNCFCAMPRWYRVADYNLFAVAWNDLVQHVDDIMRTLSAENIIPNNHVLSDWVVLSLLRIHICLEMNCSPFLVTEHETNALLKKIEGDQTWSQNDEFFSPILRSVKQGLYSVMEYIKLKSQEHALPKHHQAFKTWVEYGLPMLSIGDYVSEGLGNWIAYQWIMLLITNDDGKNGPRACFQTSKCDQKCLQALEEKYGLTGLRDSNDKSSHACDSCAYPRFRLVQWILNNPKQTQIMTKHNSQYFLQEYAKKLQIFHQLKPTANLLKLALKEFLPESSHFDDSLRKVTIRLRNLERQLQREKIRYRAIEKIANERLTNDANSPRHISSEEKLLSQSIRMTILEQKLKEAQKKKNEIQSQIEAQRSSGSPAGETEKYKKMLENLKKQWIDDNNVYENITIAMKEAEKAIKVSGGN